MFNNFDNGCIILYLGPMFGSKSSALYDELIRRHYGGQKSLMVKKTSDTRYDQYKIETHDHKYSNVIKIENKGKINVYELNKEIKIHTINCEYLYEIDDIQEVDSIISELKNEHKKCRHIVYAYKFDNIEKSYADKEPNGTTRGLIDIIHRKELNRVLIVVIRYFGGTLLGSGLLTRTYTKVVSMLFIE